MIVIVVKINEEFCLREQFTGTCEENKETWSEVYIIKYFFSVSYNVYTTLLQKFLLTISSVLHILLSES